MTGPGQSHTRDAVNLREPLQLLGKFVPVRVAARYEAVGQTRERAHIRAKLQAGSHTRTPSRNDLDAQVTTVPPAVHNELSIDRIHLGSATWVFRTPPALAPWRFGLDTRESDTLFVLLLFHTSSVTRATTELASVEGCLMAKQAGNHQSIPHPSLPRWRDA